MREQLLEQRVREKTGELLATQEELARSLALIKREMAAAGKFQKDLITKRYPAVRNIIREENLHQLQNAIVTSRNVGMQTMEDALASLYDQGLITLDQALLNANQPDELRSLLDR